MRICCLLHLCLSPQSVQETAVIKGQNHTSSSIVESTTMVQTAPLLMFCSIVCESSGAGRNQGCLIRDILSPPCMEFLCIALTKKTSPKVVSAGPEGFCNYSKLSFKCVLCVHVKKRVTATVTTHFSALSNVIRLGSDVHLNQRYLDVLKGFFIPHSTLSRQTFLVGFAVVSSIHSRFFSCGFRIKITTASCSHSTTSSDSVFVGWF